MSPYQVAPLSKSSDVVIRTHHSIEYSIEKSTQHSIEHSIEQQVGCLPKRHGRGHADTSQLRALAWACASSTHSAAPVHSYGPYIYGPASSTLCAVPVYNHGLCSDGPASNTQGRCWDCVAPATPLSAGLYTCRCACPMRMCVRAIVMTHQST